MKIGILGGTFDPIHEGHLALARAAVNQLTLDKLIFVPAYQHPILEKRNRTYASPEDRFKMVRLAVEHEPRFEVSDEEIKRKDISYTVDTLRAFRSRYPAPHELFFITGGDWAKGLNQWKNMDAIFLMTRFVVAKRPRFNTEQLPKGIEFLDFRPLDISSTEVRKRLAKGDVNCEEIPEIVITYIKQHHLYRF